MTSVSSYHLLPACPSGTYFRHGASRSNVASDLGLSDLKRRLVSVNLAPVTHIGCNCRIGGLHQFHNKIIKK